MRGFAPLWTAMIAVNVAGCALMPSALLLEQAHQSSAAQHLMRAPTDYGTSSTSLMLRWQPCRRVSIDAGEGVSYSASVVPHHPEVFSARVDLQLWARSQ